MSAPHDPDLCGCENHADYCPFNPASDYYKGDDMAQTIKDTFSPGMAAEELLKRLRPAQAISYAERCVEGPTIRGATFWKATRDILRSRTLGDS